MHDGIGLQIGHVLHEFRRAAGPLPSAVGGDRLQRVQLTQPAVQDPEGRRVLFYIMEAAHISPGLDQEDHVQVFRKTQRIIRDHAHAAGLTL